MVRCFVRNSGIGRYFAPGSIPGVFIWTASNANEDLVYQAARVDPGK